MKKEVIKQLIEKGITVSFAESCTGGSLASEFTRVPGASNVFKGSFVTYSDEYKEKYVHVDKKTILTYGVVSKEVAIEMAKGVRKETGAMLTVATTGNAGPTQGDLDQPVGKIFVAFDYKGLVQTYELDLKGERDENIEDTVYFVYNEIGKFIAKENN